MSMAQRQAEMLAQQVVPADVALERQRGQQFFAQLIDGDKLMQLQPMGPAAVYDAMVTSWLIVLQRLHGGATLQQTVASFIETRALHTNAKGRLAEGRLSANSGAYSRARTRLELSVLEHLSKHVFDSLVTALLPPVGDRRAFILDGTTIQLSPTPELKKAFPPASNQHGDSVWPIALLVVAHELESGCALRPEVGAMYGPEATSEVALTKQILPKLPANSVLLADRNFGVFAIAWGARQAGHELVSRLTSLVSRSFSSVPSATRPRRTSGYVSLEGRLGTQSRRSPFASRTACRGEHQCVDL